MKAHLPIVQIPPRADILLRWNNELRMCHSCQLLVVCTRLIETHTNKMSLCDTITAGTGSANSPCQPFMKQLRNVTSLTFEAVPVPSERWDHAAFFWKSSTTKRWHFSVCFDKYMLGVSSLCSKPGCVRAAGLKSTQILSKYASGWKFRCTPLLYLLFISGIKINTGHMVSTWDCFPSRPVGRNSFTCLNWMNTQPFESVYNTWLHTCWFFCAVEWNTAWNLLMLFVCAVVKWWKTSPAQRKWWRNS